MAVLELSKWVPKTALRNHANHTVSISQKIPLVFLCTVHAKSLSNVSINCSRNNDQPEVMCGITFHDKELQYY